MSVTQTSATGAGLFGTQAVAPGTPHVVGRVEDVRGSLHATQAACPHAGGPLADGQTDQDVLVCPLHLYTFRWTDGTSPGGAAPLRQYPVHEESGQLVVTV
jgi:nitrite reductase (NADH) small subunit